MSDQLIFDTSDLYADQICYIHNSDEFRDRRISVNLRTDETLRWKKISKNMHSDDLTQMIRRQLAWSQLGIAYTKENLHIWCMDATTPHFML